MSKMIKTRKEHCIDIYNDVHRSILELEVDTNMINRSLITTKDPQIYEKLKQQLYRNQLITKDKRIVLVELEGMINDVEQKSK